MPVAPAEAATLSTSQDEDHMGLLRSSSCGSSQFSRVSSEGQGSHGALFGMGNQCTLSEGEELLVLQESNTGGRLMLACFDSRPPANYDQGIIYLGLARALQYVALCADFGPYNLGTTHQVISILRKAFRSRSDATVVFYTTHCPADVVNAVYLLGAYLCLEFNATPEQAWQPFAGLDPALLPPYRDATWVESTFDIYLRDCWAGLRRAVSTGLYDPATFDKVLCFFCVFRAAMLEASVLDGCPCVIDAYQLTRRAMGRWSTSTTTILSTATCTRLCRGSLWR